MPYSRTRLKGERKNTKDRDYYLFADKRARTSCQSSLEVSLWQFKEIFLHGYVMVFYF